MVNNFDHLASERIVLSAKYWMNPIIHCGTCMRGYCFYCARTHTDPGVEHEMKLIEPRVVHEAQVGKFRFFTWTWPSRHRTI